MLLNLHVKNIALIREADIDLSEHKFITFDFDRLISKLGGIFSYLLILYGFFSLGRGYVYFNLTVTVTLFVIFVSGVIFLPSI